MMELNGLLDRMAALGARRFLVKKLAANDNSKNQIYVGGSSDVFAVLPPVNIRDDMNQRGEPSFKAELSFRWLNDVGEFSEAPGAQLVYYPQYPEVRLSGFLRASPRAPSQVLRGRADGRVLVLGVAPDRRIIGFACDASHPVARVIASIGGSPDDGVFYSLELAVPTVTDPKRKLLEEICRISQLGWMAGERLRSDGSRVPCNSSNCGGYTLEAELGITPNGYSEPDYLGWEVKSFTVSSLEVPRGGAITLMTPEPNGGIYTERGPVQFVRQFGYADVAGRADRINFGGIFRAGELSERTGLRLDLIGFDREQGRLTASNGCLALVDRHGIVAASWSFSGLLKHWTRKHAKAVYVPSQMMTEDGNRRYRFSRQVHLGAGTEFNHLLNGIAAGRVYYDPGLKVENASSPRPRVKRRSQFRIHFSRLSSLYYDWTAADACA